MNKITLFVMKQFIHKCILFVFLFSSGVSGVFSTYAKSKVPQTVAYSQVSRSYTRELLPNGQWKAETYAFGEGQLIDRKGEDLSLNALTFRGIGDILAAALEEESYLPTTSPEETDLLILVSWGRTLPYDDGIKSMSIQGMGEIMSSLSQIQSQIEGRSGAQAFETSAIAAATPAERSQLSYLTNEMEQMFMMQQMSDNARYQANAYNARLLGYTPELYKTNTILGVIGPLHTYRQDLIDELETSRYFVILQAYDFQKMWKHKQKDLRWTTRFSIRAKGRRFDEELETMSLAACQLFGDNSGKFRKNLRPGKVIIGELEMLGVVEE